MDWEIPLVRMYWDEQDVAEISAAIRSGVSWAIGPNVEKFEQGIAEYIGTRHALVFNSGTSALHAVLLAYGIGKEDEVIVPSFTFIATANAPVFVGAKPVFAEIEETTCGLDPVDVKRRITSKTKAILPIHCGGCPCLVDQLKMLADEHGLLLIEDAAEAFGAHVNGKKVGSFGDAAILSFCQNKVITTGEGGAVVTDSREVYEKLKLIRSHGRLETGDFFSSMEYMDYVALGYNFRMSNITAALGIAQLAKVDRIIEMRRNNAQHMTKALSNIKGLEIPSVPEGFRHVYQIYTVRLPEARVRDGLMKHLAEKGIMTRIYFHPVHLTGFYRREFGCRQGDLPVTEKIASEVLSLPMHPTLTGQEINYIGEQVAAFLA